MKQLAFSLLLLLSGIAQGHEPAAAEPKGGGMRVLVYSNTGYYRHPDTPKINRWLVLLGHENGFEVDVTEHWKDMRAEELSRYDVLVLNNANELDKVLPEQQRKAVEEWFTKGEKGIVGLHAALVHQTKWPWLHALGGCDFNSDSDFSRARVRIDPAARDHPSSGPHSGVRAVFSPPGGRRGKILAHTPARPPRRREPCQIPLPSQATGAGSMPTAFRS